MKKDCATFERVRKMPYSVITAYADQLFEDYNHSKLYRLGGISDIKDNIRVVKTVCEFIRPRMDVGFRTRIEGIILEAERILK